MSISEPKEKSGEMFVFLYQVFILCICVVLIATVGFLVSSK